MDRLRTRFLKRPVYLMPAIADEEETEPVIPEAPRRPRTPVSVTDYAHRAYERLSNADFSGAVADYSAAIRLNSRYLDAYYNRGLARARWATFPARSRIIRPISTSAAASVPAIRRKSSWQSAI